MNEDKNFSSGAVIDTRPEPEKQKDYKAAEVVASAAPVKWVEKKPSEWRKFPIFNQDGSGSCVAQTEAKELGVMRFLKDGQYVHFSATDIYQQRSNKPSAGMIAVDCRNIAKKGVTLEALVPSQNMSDAQMDAVKIEPYKREVGAVFAVPNYLELPIKDIDAVASVIQETKKAVMVWFFFENREWTDKPVVLNPNLDLYAASTARHSVAAVDFALVDGKKCLIIDDSWGSSYGQAGQRAISEEFYIARNWYASYLINFRFEDPNAPTPNKPRHTFNVNLTWSPTPKYGNADIIALQDILKYEGLFPANVESTGYYGSITAKAVLAFQRKYQVGSEAELASLEGKLVGTKTRAKLNQLYS